MERINHTRFRPTFCKTLQPDTDRDIKIRTPVLAFHPDCIFSKTSSICVCFVFLTSFTDVFSDFLVALKSQLNVPLRVFIVNKQMHVYFLNTLIVCGALSHNKWGKHISLLITLLQSWFFLGWSNTCRVYIPENKKNRMCSFAHFLSIRSDWKQYKNKCIYRRVDDGQYSEVAPKTQGAASRQRNQLA